MNVDCNIKFIRLNLKTCFPLFFSASSSPPSATQITAILAHSSQELLYLGTESGNVFVVELPSFRVLEDQIISPEEVLQR